LEEGGRGEGREEDYEEEEEEAEAADILRSEIQPD
jgi:hypothetical protein